MTVIKNIIFDFGGVLIDWNPKYVFEKLFEDPKDMDYFFTNICTGDWNEEQDAGRSIVAATMEKINQFPSYEKYVRAYYGQWTDMLGGPIEENVQLLRKFNAGNQYRLFGLTNWSAETFPFAQVRYDFLGIFEDIVVSGAEMMKKPDPRIYQLLLTRNRLTAEECIFLDDNIRNVEAAKKEGIHAIQVSSPKQLQNDLSALGIL